MRSSRLFLEDIIDAIDRIDEFLAEMDQFAFANDEKTKAAVLHKLAVIGEAARHLRDDFAGRYPQVDWDKAAGLRNIIAHEYFSIDYEIVYRTARGSLPKLREQIAAILATGK
jgi:uncharacterized protein with HEPN domain